MQLRRLVFAFLLAAATATSAHAGPDTYQATPSDLYVAPQGNGSAIPSGAINVTPGNASQWGATKESFDLGAYTSNSAPVPTDTTNLLGCGGVGQGEYTSGIYNMPESFSKFQQDVNSSLAHQLLTINYIMPQTAALFDQLNNYGNQRYQTFKQGCTVDPLKQDARNQYLNSCVTKILPQRTQIVRTMTDSAQTGNEDAASKVSEDAINAMAYAQAWEVCTNQYVSDTTALTARKDTITAFAKQTRAVENITLALQPLLCQPRGNDKSGHGCWPTLLLPQVRICLDSTLGCDGKGPNGYGVKDAVVPASRLFDTLRYLMDDTIIAHRVSPFHQMLTDKSVPGATRKLAASEAGLTLSAAGLVRKADGSVDGNVTPGGGGSEIVPPGSVIDFQFNYMNCNQSDIMNPLKQYANKINARLASSGAANTSNVSLTELKAEDFDPIMKRLGLDDSSEEDKTALRDLAYTSLGCTANQSVPIFDPVLTASVNACSPDDRYAFYTMAEADVASAATRDVYRYLALRLKQAYTQLMTQAAVPAAASTDPNATAATPTLSPELNARLATAVKEVMIPYVESQITRLNDLNNTRGDFGQRVQQILATKQGCMFNSGYNVAPPAKNTFTGGGGGF